VLVLVSGGLWSRLITELNGGGGGGGTLRDKCVTFESEKSVVNQHNVFRKMMQSNHETTCFGL